MQLADHFEIAYVPCVVQADSVVLLWHLKTKCTHFLQLIRDLIWDTGSFVVLRCVVDLDEELLHGVYHGREQLARVVIQDLHSNAPFDRSMLNKKMWNGSADIHFVDQIVTYVRIREHVCVLKFSFEKPTGEGRIFIRCIRR